MSYKFNLEDEKSQSRVSFFKRTPLGTNAAKIAGLAWALISGWAGVYWNSHNPTPEEINLAIDDAEKKKNKLEKDYPWIKDQTEVTPRITAIMDCIGTCSHHVDSGRVYIDLSKGRMCP